MLVENGLKSLIQRAVRYAMLKNVDILGLFQNSFDPPSFYGISHFSTNILSISINSMHRLTKYFSLCFPSNLWWKMLLSI